MNQTQVSLERWQAAQAAELRYWLDQIPDGEDWNAWWWDKFNGFQAVDWWGERVNVPINFVLEVGCGPYAKNIRWIDEVYGGGFHLGINDPLIFQYALAGKAVRDMMADGAFVNWQPLEEMELDCLFDVCICINVLDHVQNVHSCFDRMHQALNAGGYLILGQDLTNEEDCRNCPDVLTDVKHPILMDMATLEPFLEPYEPIFKKILPRNEGRNPAAHYGTLLFIGRKK